MPTTNAKDRSEPKDDESQDQYIRTFDLEREEELRFEVGWDEVIELHLLQGMAELFGTELATNTGYRFVPGMKRAVFTYQGCKLSIKSHDITEYYTDTNVSNASSSSAASAAKKQPRKLNMNLSALTNAYVAGSTPMPNYLALHKKLEKYRLDQRQKTLQGEAADIVAPSAQGGIRWIGGSGARVLVAGPTDSGKSSLCRILCNYAMREVSPEYTQDTESNDQYLHLNSHNKIAFVDLDVGQNHISIPGVMAATELREPISIVDEFSLSSPLAFFYGHTSPNANATLYKRLVERLAEVIAAKQRRDEHMRRGGVIINTCGWIEGLGFQLLLHTARAFQCTHIYIMGDDRLTANLKRELKGKPVHIERLRKSGGVVQRSSNYRERARDVKFREYFEGMDNNISPHSIVIKFDEVDIFQIGGAMSAPKSALPIGQKSAIDPCELRPVEMNALLTHSVLGVSQARKEEDILAANLYGYLFVKKVDTEKRELHVLSPSPAKPPARFLLCGTLKLRW